MGRNLQSIGHSARGFTLIEALVALLVLSIGLLGVAGMQLKALQSAHVGYQRSIASLAAQDAVERLWSRFDADNMECLGLADESQWLLSWQVHIPNLLGDVSRDNAAGECAFKVTLEWNDSRLANESEDGLTKFIYKARLPGGE